MGSACSSTRAVGHHHQRGQQLPGGVDHGRREPRDPLVDLLPLPGPAVPPYLGDLGEKGVDVDDRLRRDLLEWRLDEHLAEPLVVELREVELPAAGGMERPSLAERHGVLERPGAVDEVDRDTVRALEPDQLGRLAEHGREPLEVPAPPLSQDLDGGRRGQAPDEPRLTA